MPVGISPRGGDEKVFALAIIVGKRSDKKNGLLQLPEALDETEQIVVNAALVSTRPNPSSVSRNLARKNPAEFGFLGHRFLRPADTKARPENKRADVSAKYQFNGVGSQIVRIGQSQPGDVLPGPLNRVKAVVV